MNETQRQIKMKTPNRMKRIHIKLYRQKVTKNNIKQYVTNRNMRKRVGNKRIRPEIRQNYRNTLTAVTP